MDGDEQGAIEQQISDLRRRLHELDRSAPVPNPALAVGFLSLLVLQGGHEAEHVVQVVQRFVLNIPDGNGLLGSVFAVEPLHFFYNLTFFWLLVLVYRASGAPWPERWTRGRPAWWLLTLAIPFQAYHLVEHVVKLWQYIDTGLNGTPGILGNVFNLVWLHFFFNTTVYLMIVLAFWQGRFYRHLRRDLHVAWEQLVERSGVRVVREAPADAPRLTRRAVVVGGAGAAVGLGTAGFASVIRRPPLVLPTFRDVTSRAGITFRHQAYPLAEAIQAGAAFLDFNGDGRLDLFLTNSNGANALYRNNGDGTFTDVANQAGVADPDGIGIGVACADYNNDGHCDLLLTRMGGLRLFRNDGAGAFSDVTAKALLDVRMGHPASAVWTDFNGDGYLDLYVTCWLDQVPDTHLAASTAALGDAYTAQARRHHLFQNNGDGTFRDVSAYLGGDVPPSAGLAIGAFDYDGDGRPDLYVVNDFGMYVHPNALYHNEGPVGNGWAFRDVSHAAGVDAAIYGMGLAIGDYDGDGRPDVYVTNMGDNVLYHNRGDGTFERATNRAGVGRGVTRGGDSVGGGPAFLDYDNDGRLDLYFVAGAMYPQPNADGTYPPDQPNALFQNRGDGTFRDVSALTKTDNTRAGRGLAVADFDGDGFLDLLVANYDQPPVLLKNAGNANRWLAVKLVGTRSNRDGIGARLTLKAGGQSQLREICSGTSFLSQHSLVAHFGVAQVGRADDLTIRWPSGIVQTLTNVATNQQITVTEAV